MHIPVFRPRPVIVPTTPAGPALHPMLSPLMHRVCHASIGQAAQGGVPAPLMLSHGNTLQHLMADTSQIFESMRGLISEARREVLLQTYAWQDDSTPARTLRQGLLQLAQRQAAERQGGARVEPVLVRVMLRKSPLGRLAGRRTTALERLIKSLDPSLVQAGLYDHCERCCGALHSKSLVCDGAVAVLTGANPEHKNDAGKSWFDSGCVLTGEVVRGLRADALGVMQHCKVRCSNSVLGAPAALEPPGDRSQAGVPMLVISKRGQGIPWIRRSNDPQAAALLTAMAGAQERICMVTPNLNAKPVIDALLDALRRGVRVDLLLPRQFDRVLNSRLMLQGGGNDHTVRLMRRALRRTPQALACLDVRWFSWDGQKALLGNQPGASHAKGICLDGQLLFFHSLNHDTQSFYHSREIGVVMDNALCAKRWCESIFWPRFHSAVRA